MKKPMSNTSPEFLRKAIATKGLFRDFLYRKDRIRSFSAQKKIYKKKLFVIIIHLSLPKTKFNTAMQKKGEKICENDSFV